MGSDGTQITQNGDRTPYGVGGILCKCKLLTFKLVKRETFVYIGCIGGVNVIMTYSAIVQLTTICKIPT